MAIVRLTPNAQVVGSSPTGGSVFRRRGPSSSGRARHRPPVILFVARMSIVVDEIEPDRVRPVLLAGLREAHRCRLNQTPPGPIQDSPSPHTAIDCPVLVMASSP